MAYNRVRFEWDTSKDHANRRKHGLSFADACSLFLSGVDYLEVFDAAHSETEDRFLAIGLSRRGLVVVAWADRGDDVIRIISARPATRREARAWAAHRERLDE